MGILAALFIGLTAAAQTTLPYRPLSDPYAASSTRDADATGVRSATTLALPDDDQRDPGVNGADGKVAVPEPMNRQPSDDEE